MSECGSTGHTAASTREPFGGQKSGRLPVGQFLQLLPGYGVLAESGFQGQGFHFLRGDCCKSLDRGRARRHRCRSWRFGGSRSITRRRRRRVAGRRRRARLRRTSAQRSHPGSFSGWEGEAGDGSWAGFVVTAASWVEGSPSAGLVSGWGSGAVGASPWRVEATPSGGVASREPNPHPGCSTPPTRGRFLRLLPPKRPPWHPPGSR